MFGNINNGGHFNPIVTLGILLQQYDDDLSLSEGFVGIHENLRFAILVILS